MTARLQAWIRQAQNDLAMAEFARSGGFYAQALTTPVKLPKRPLRAPRKISIWQWLFGHEKAAK